MKKIISVLIIILFLSSCKPSQSQIEHAIAETQTAMPTNMPTPQPTSTSTLKPTMTKTQAPTNAPTSEVLSTEEYLSLVADKIKSNCKSFSEIKTCSVNISYSVKDSAVLVEIEADDMEIGGIISDVLLPQSLKYTKEAYGKTQMFRPNTLIVIFSDGQTTEETYAKWDTVEGYMNDTIDYSAFSFELIVNRYIGK